MIYKMFASTYSSAENIEKAKQSINALNLSIYTKTHIVEAKTKELAVEQFYNKYEEEIQQLDRYHNETIYFYYVTDDGSIVKFV